MHILLMVAGVLASAAFWYYRLRVIHGAGTEVVDALGRAKGKYRRTKIRKASAESPIAAIDDPVVACATLIYHLLQNPDTVPAQDSEIAGKLAAFTDQAKAEEAAVYGRWAAHQGVDHRKAMKMLFEKLESWLSPDELLDVAQLVEDLDGSDLFDLVSTRKDAVVLRFGNNHSY